MKKQQNKTNKQKLVSLVSKKTLQTVYNQLWSKTFLKKRLI